MKVESKFNPVTITLETQAEVDGLRAVIGKVAEGDSGVAFSALYNALSVEVSDYPLVEVDEEASSYAYVLLKKSSAA